jgi:hypothetical protein
MKPVIAVLLTEPLAPIIVPPELFRIPLELIVATSVCPTFNVRNEFSV